MGVCFKLFIKSIFKKEKKYIPHTYNTILRKAKKKIKEK